MQIKRRKYWEEQEKSKKARLLKEKREKQLMGIFTNPDAEKEYKAKIKPPVEAPPLEKYDEIYYECLKELNDEIHPEQEFVIHTIKQQLARKKREMAAKAKEQEEKEKKEREQAEIQSFVKKQYEEQKMRKKLMEMEIKEKQNIGVEVSRKTSFLPFFIHY